jgi:hypothetical protein
VTTVTYYGHVTMTYPHYTDLATGRTLVAVPGQTYNVAPASGNILSAGTLMPVDGRFAAGTDKVEEKDSSDESDDKKGMNATKGTMPSRMKE